MLLLCLSTWGNNVSKNTSFLYNRNWKNMGLMCQHKAITKIETDVCLFFFSSFLSHANTAAIKRAPATRRLSLAHQGWVSSVTWHRDTGKSP